ncbi:heavy metal-associated domain-containing protein [Brevundimonas sp. M20]|uniref:heavy-metal-associated domain-containing protein n=1 Tax=Brevundimonas sp. M20 TaxID=2591463 RepID=UPI0011470C17|nr:heavy metal-associated domain-containing protein [Brevundimonas sp. M20]QDH72139.1 heavy-metal-associated domain-containing protein [Brevundimonas sp. M20]
MKTLASLTAALSLLAAGSASAQEARIQWADLNLASSAGAAALDQRIEVAARDLCRTARRPGSRLSDRDFCEAAVRREALRQLPGAAQVDYAASRAVVAY